MRFWLRELAGWALVLLGLFFFYICLAMLLSDRPLIIRSGPIAVIGIFVFRGGIHLLKVAVAARICLHAERLARRPDAAKTADGPKRPLAIVSR